MAVAFDAKTASYTDVVSTSLSVTNLTVGSGSNRAIVLDLVCGDSATFPASISITRDTGETFTQISGTLNGDGGTSTTSALYGLLNPTAGNVTIAISWTGSHEMHASAVSFTGVNQTSVAVAFPHGNKATGSASGTASVTVTSATGNMAVASFSQLVAVFSSTSGTTIAIDTVGPNDGPASCYDNGAATVTLTASFSPSNNWASTGCDVLAAAGGAAIVVGWWNESADVYSASPLKFAERPAFVSTFRTAGISGSAWNAQRDHARLPPSVVFSDAPAYGHPAFAAPSTIAGIAWYEPPDRDAPAKKINIEALPAFVSTFQTAGIAGIAWSGPREHVRLPAPVSYSYSPAFVSTFKTAPVSGMAWFIPPDSYGLVEKIIGGDGPAIGSAPTPKSFGWFVAVDVTGIEKPQIQQYDPSDVQRPFGAAVGISGMAWYKQPDIPGIIEKVFDSGIAGPTNAITQVAFGWFVPPDRDRPAPKANVESLPAYVRPPKVFTPISGIGWFEPPDRDAPATKFKIEAPPSISLTPATLPAKISGMAWFQPRDRDWHSASVTFDQPPAFVRSPFTTITGTLAATEGYDIASFVLSFSRWTHKNIQSETWANRAKQDETWIVRTIQPETWTPE